MTGPENGSQPVSSGKERNARPMYQGALIRSDWPHYIIVFLALFLVYAVTSSHTVGLEDDGLFILTSYSAGIGHPPGYPLFILIGRLFSFLPLGSVAYKVHLASAFGGAAACAALWWVVRLLVPGRIPAYAAALTFGLSATFWSQSIVAEVYSLNCFFFFLVLAMCLKLSHQDRVAGSSTTRLLVFTAFVYGLSLSNHWPLMVLASPAFLILAWPALRQILRKLHYLVPAFLLGLSPYAWMVLRSHSDPAASFYGPIDSLAEFLFIVSRAGYQGVDQSPSAGMLDKVLFGGHFIRATLEQLTFAGFLLAAAGLVMQKEHWGPRVTAALIVAFLCSSFLLIGLLGFDYDALHIAAFRVYPLVAFGVMAIWLGLGFHVVSAFLGRKLNISSQSHLLAFAMLALISLTSLLTGWKVNDRSEFTYPEEYAKSVLNSLPQNAVLFASDDVGFGTTAYTNLVLGYRPDITLYQVEGLVLRNRLFDPITAQTGDRISALYEFMSGSEGPIYIMGSDLPDSGYDSMGFYARMRSDLRSGSGSEFDERLFVAYNDLMSGTAIEDEWQAIHRGYLSYEFGWVMGASQVEDEQQLLGRLADFPVLTEKNLNGLLGVSLGMVANKDRLYPNVLLELLRRIELLVDRNTSFRELSVYFYLQGIYSITQQDAASAERYLLQSIETWPHDSELARTQLENLYAELGQSKEDSGD